MKSFARSIITKILWYQVRVLRKKHNLVVVGVVGSIGKTSTKFAIAQMLEDHRKVRWQKGNYNDITIIPLVFFGQDIPSLFNPIAWLKVIINNQRQIKAYPYEIVVLELGTDSPGQILEFKQYIDLDIAVVTAVTPEHMEYFKTIDAVAKEELAVAEFAKKLIINNDLVDKKYLTADLKYISYGSVKADYVAELAQKLSIKKSQQAWLKLPKVLTPALAYSINAGLVVGDLLGLSHAELKSGVDNIKPVPGRLQLLEGYNNSTIIDDTYNASPYATIASLDVLYQQATKNKIALLGDMNELGETSKFEHERVGKYCDPNKLDLLVTVGPESNKYLAKEAKARGCEVKSFDDPYKAGEYVKTQITNDTFILAKGSQNNVYMEEAVKIFLAKPEDSKKLVRQSNNWLAKKRKNFKR